MRKVTVEQFLQILSNYRRNIERRRDEIPFAIKSSIITQIIRTGSIDTTKFIQAVDFREDGMDADGFRYLIDSSRDSEVTYDGFVETDGVTRRWTGRWNYRDGIENTNFRPVFDSIADDTFAR